MITTSRPRCGASTTPRAGTCRNYPMRGQVRCLKHGGGSPQARQKGQSRILEADAMKSLSKYGFQPVENPLEKLMSLGGQALSMKDFLLRRVTSDSVSGAEASAFERWLDRCERILSNLVRLNIEERQLALSQKHTAILVEAFELFARGLGHDTSAPDIRLAIGSALGTANNNARDRQIRMA